MTREEFGFWGIGLDADTFAALEGAFARRFHQLFGGGEAQLSLTDPADLTSTGVEENQTRSGFVGWTRTCE